MTIRLVSRHPGAVAWLRRRYHLTQALLVPHLDVVSIESGDHVIGTLPVQAIAEVWARGATYHHLVIPLTADLRGWELTADELDAAGATLQCFYAERRDDELPIG